MNTKLCQTPLKGIEFKKTFKFLKRNKTSGSDGLDISIIKSVHEHIKTPLLKIFNESILLRCMKIKKVTSIFKSGRKELLTNYTPISILSCFSKILERISTTDCMII